MTDFSRFHDALVLLFRYSIEKNWEQSTLVASYTLSRRMHPGSNFPEDLFVTHTR